MNIPNPSEETLVDFITGKSVANIGAEEHRQKVERFLAEQKGYDKSDIVVDADIELSVGGEIYRSQLDLVVKVDGRAVMVVKCVAASLDSREKEIVSAARAALGEPVPIGVVTDGQTALIWDAASGMKIGEGLAHIPSKSEVARYLQDAPPIEISPARREKEKIIFRSYDSMNVNVQRKRKMPPG